MALSGVAGKLRFWRGFSVHGRFPLKSLKVFSLSLGFLIAAIPLFAHHGNAAYDAKNPLTLKGTVTEWFWANPHCILQFDVKDDKGQIVHWSAETSNPADMVNRNWSKVSLKPGDQVTVTLEPAKNGRLVGRVLEVVFPNGQALSGGFGSLEKQPLAGPSGGSGAAPKSDDSPKK
jgi:hypothetical protein